MTNAMLVMVCRGGRAKLLSEEAGAWVVQKQIFLLGTFPDQDDADGKRTFTIDTGFTEAIINNFNAGLRNRVSLCWTHPKAETKDTLGEDPRTAVYKSGVRGLAPMVDGIDAIIHTEDHAAYRLLMDRQADVSAAWLPDYKGHGPTLTHVAMVLEGFFKNMRPAVDLGIYSPAAGAAAAATGDSDGPCGQVYLAEKFFRKGEDSMTKEELVKQLKAAGCDVADLELHDARKADRAILLAELKGRFQITPTETPTLDLAPVNVMLTEKFKRPVAAKTAEEVVREVELEAVKLADGQAALVKEREDLRQETAELKAGKLVDDLKLPPAERADYKALYLKDPALFVKLTAGMKPRFGKPRGADVTGVTTELTAKQIEDIGVKEMEGRGKTT